ncbi:MAG: acyltransferase [Alphaproteobacteria bacterium]|nr:acyltransferase [Alphaproteobacteria bacterium]
MDKADLVRLLHEVRLEREADLKARFDRSLSFADSLFDRWERAKRLGFGEGSSIYDSALVYGEVTVGPNTWVGPYTLLDGTGGGLMIGSWCSISTGVHIYTHDTVLKALSGGKIAKREASVRIGDCVYIGGQCIITAGVTIGERCVVAANSLVTKSVPPGTIVGGTPAKPFGRVEGEGENVKLVFDRKEAKARVRR